MDAPVYRHADARATLFGLNFPGDFFVVLVASYLWLMVLEPPAFLAATATTYLAVALLNRGRPPQHWAHWLSFQLRRLRYRGEVSAAARSRAPQFPFGPCARLGLGGRGS